MIVSGLVGLSKEDVVRHVEVAFRNGPDINFKKVKMEEHLVVEMLLEKQVAIHNPVLVRFFLYIDDLLESTHFVDLDFL